LKRIGDRENAADAAKRLMLDATYVSGQIREVDDGREIVL